MSDIRAVHGNFFETWHRHIEEHSVDLIVTSPPYNVGKTYDSFTDTYSASAWCDFLDDMFTLFEMILKPEGSVFINFGTIPSQREAKVMFEKKMIEVFQIQNEIIWVKSITVNNTSRGQFKPIGGSRFLNPMHESIYHLSKDKDVKLNRKALAVQHQDQSNKKRFKSTQDGRCRGDVWFIPYETKQKRGGHPCPFPVALPTNCILLHGAETGLVVDPFVGSGTTLLAAQNLGWNAVGFDISEKYIQLCDHRLGKNANPNSVENFFT